MGSEGSRRCVYSKHLLDERTIAAMLVCILSSMVLLGASAEPPIVAIPSLQEIENGSSVRVQGVLVDYKRYDSGAEGLILADLEDGSTVKIVSLPGLRQQPSSYVHIGDELVVNGEVSINGSSVVVFTGSDDIVLSRQSELVLTVEALSRNWFLFDGDLVRVKGVLELAEGGANLRLRDFACGCTITVLAPYLDLGPFVGRTVTLTTEVRFDFWLSLLTLLPSYANGEQ